MVLDKDLWKHRSWELTVDELKTKQKKCRNMMWFTFTIWACFFITSSLFFMMRYLVTSTYLAVITAMLLMVVFTWKYFEMRIDTIIEIRRNNNG